MGRTKKSYLGLRQTSAGGCPVRALLYPGRRIAVGAATGLGKSPPRTSVMPLGAVCPGLVAPGDMARHRPNAARGETEAAAGERLGRCRSAMSQPAAPTHRAALPPIIKYYQQSHIN